VTDGVVQRTWQLTCPRCAVLYAVKEPPLPGENRTCAKCGATWKPAEDIAPAAEGAKDDLVALVEDALGKGAKETARIVLAVVNERLLALEALQREHAALVEEIDELVVAVDDSLPDVDVDGEGGQGNHVERIEFAGAALEAQNRIIEDWRDRCERAEHERDTAAAELATVVAERDRLLVEVERLKGEVDTKRPPDLLIARVVMERHAWGGVSGVFAADEVAAMTAWARDVLRIGP
jgi:hypothetical protein